MEKSVALLFNDVNRSPSFWEYGMFFSSEEVFFQILCLSLHCR